MFRWSLTIAVLLIPLAIIARLLGSQFPDPETLITLGIFLAAVVLDVSFGSMSNLGPVERFVYYWVERLTKGAKLKEISVGSDVEKPTPADKTLPEGSAASPADSTPIERPSEDIETKTITSPGEFGPTIPVGPDRAERVVDLLYGTNRDKLLTFGSLDRSSERYYGDVVADLTFGLVRVRVPERHTPGNFERPFKFRLTKKIAIEFPVDEAKHFNIESVRPLEEAVWSQLVRLSRKNEALLYVHGYNTRFTDTMLKFAQIVYDLKCEALPVAFSWPSMGTVVDYPHDKDAAFHSRQAFLDLLQKLKDLEISRVHVLAHSMGNLVVLTALETANLIKLGKLEGQLMMAAPDVLASVYPPLVAKAAAFFGGATLYASSEDKVLRLSSFIGGSEPRAGQVGNNGPITGPGYDAIDVSVLGEDMLGHGVVSTSTSILSDVQRLITVGGRPPDIRGTNLLPVPDDGTSPRYWRYTKPS